MKTIELFTTTVDAVGMGTDISGPAMIALMIPVLWCTLLFLVCVYLALREKTASTARKAVIALGIVVVPALWTPYVVADFEYSEDVLHRMVKVPALDAHSSFSIHRSEVTPGPENKTVVAAVHDKFQDELDQHRDTLDKMGLSDQCEILRDLNKDPNDMSVLCGGYLVEPVVARGMEVTPVIETSADHVWRPWSIDPHNVEVTASIKIDKE